MIGKIRGNILIRGTLCGFLIMLAVCAVLALAASSAGGLVATACMWMSELQQRNAGHFKGILSFPDHLFQYPGKYRVRYANMIHEACMADYKSIPIPIIPANGILMSFDPPAICSRVALSFRFGRKRASALGALCANTGIGSLRKAEPVGRNEVSHSLLSRVKLRNQWLARRQLGR